MRPEPPTGPSRGQRPIAAAIHPPRLVQPTPSAAPLGLRCAALLLAAGCAVLFGLALWMTPDPSGHGTHTQLGLAPCPWTLSANRPCPTCGMTTAFCYAVRGRLLAGFLAQPAGLLVAVAVAAVFWGSLWMGLTGLRSDRLAAAILRPWLLWPMAAIVAAAWVYKLVSWPG